MKKMNCFECKKEFEYTPGKYPRKYCNECGKKRKKMWEDQWKVKFEDMDDDD